MEVGYATTTNNTEVCLIASVFNCFHTLCRHSLSRWLLIWSVLLLAPQCRVEHPTTDRTELGGGGGICNHNR